MVRAKHAKQNKTQRVLAVVATIIIVALAVLVFLYRDKLTFFKSENSDEMADIISENEPFTYETGADQFFSVMGSSLTVASSTGLQLLDSDGKTISREVFSMTNPSVCGNDSTCAVYDVGGHCLRLYMDGQFKDYDSDNEIISVSVNKGSYYTVAAYEPGYKGSATVYDADFNPIYKWYSGTGYILDAAVSPDGGTLAVLCVEETGTLVHLFHFDSEDEFASAALPGELAFKLNFSQDGNFSLLSEDAIHFFGSKGQELSVYDFEGNYLADYELESEYLAIVLSKYVSGSEVTLISFGSGGKQLGAVSLSAEPLSVFSQGQKLLVLGSSDLTLYSKNLDTVKQNHISAGFSSAVLLPKGSVLLLSSHYGEKCSMS